MNSPILDDDEISSKKYTILNGYKIKSQLFVFEILVFLIMLLGIVADSPFILLLVCLAYFLLPLSEYSEGSKGKDFLGRFLILLCGCWGTGLLYISLFGDDLVSQEWIQFRMLIAGAVLWSIGQLFYPYRYRKILNPKIKQLLFRSAIAMTISLPILIVMDRLAIPYLHELSVARLTMIAIAELFVLVLNIYFIVQWVPFLRKTWQYNRVFVYFIFRFFMLIFFNLGLMATKVYLLMNP